MLSLVLICAVIASLGAGVALAHGLCAGMFGLFRIHARQVAAARTLPTATPVSSASRA